jgi:hypothetical protein
MLNHADDILSDTFSGIATADSPASDRANHASADGHKRSTQTKINVGVALAEWKEGR